MAVEGSGMSIPWAPIQGSVGIHIRRSLVTEEMHPVLHGMDQ